MQLDVSNSSTGRVQFLNWTCPIMQLDVSDYAIEAPRLSNWGRSIE